MAAAQHTPGPWTVGLEDSTMGVLFIQIETDERAICEVSATHDDTDNEFDILDEDRANAHLIAAAPDLLVQLKGALAVANHVIASTGIDAEHTALQMVANGEQLAVVLLSTLIRNAEAAVAKAEGRA